MTAICCEISASSSTVSPVNTTLASKQQTSPSVLFILPSCQHYVHPFMPVILLTPSLSNTNLLSATFVHTSFGACSFSLAARTIRNSLPPSLHTCTSPDIFCLTIVSVYKLYLLTYLLKIVFARKTYAY